MRNWTRYLLLGFGIYSLPFITGCQGDDEELEFSATVSGKVIDFDTKSPINSVEVSFRKGSEETKSVLTNENGDYSFAESIRLQERFTITTSTAGYEDSTKTIVLTSGDQLDLLNFIIKKRASISGTVRNSESSAVIPEVTISLLNGTSGETLKTVSSNTLGVYELDDLNTGQFLLSLSKNGYEPVTKEIILNKSEQRSLDINLEPLPAVIEVSVTTVDFGSNEVSRTFEILNVGGDTIRWAVVENISWATVNPSSGEITNDASTVAITVDRQGFNPGSYAQILTVTSENSGSKEINLTMTVNGAILQIIPSELTFGIESTEESLQLERIGEGTLNYEIQTDKSWITIEPSSGSITNETDFIIVMADRTGLDFGNYEARIAFNTDNGSQIVNATLTVPDPNAPQLTIDPLTIDMGQDLAVRNISLENTGKGALNWSVSKSTSWVSVSESGGQLVEGEVANIAVLINRSSLTPGQYDDILRFTSEGGNINIPISIEVANTPVLSLSQNTLDFGRDATSQSLVISNIGNGTMTWSISTNQNWITLNPLSGTNTGTINVTVSRDGLAFGNYSGQVDVQSDGGVGTVIVQMAFLPPNQPPNANFTTSNEVINLGQEINLDASTSSDSEDALSLLEVRWRFSAASSFSEWSTGKQISATYQTQGIKEITLEVRDTDGGVSSLSKEVNVIENQPPNAVFSVNPSSGKINITQFTVDATGSNDDIDERTNLQYRWRWEDGQSFDTWSRNANNTHIYGSIGSKTITLEVMDSFNEIGSTSMQIQVSEDLTEIEPNDVFSSPNELPFETQITGSVGSNGDESDWYTVKPINNGRIRITVQNTGSGSNSTLDKAIVYSEELSVLTEATNGNSSNPRIDIGETRSSSWATVSKGLQYLIRVSRNSSVDVTTYLLFVNYEEINQVDSNEPNNSSEVATVLVAGESSTGTVGFGDDNLDWYKVTPPSNGQLSITVENLQTGSANDDLDRAILYNSELTYLVDAGSGSSCCPLIGGGAIYTSAKTTVIGGETYFIRIGPDEGLDASFYTVRANFEEITQEDTGEPNNSSEIATVLNIDEPSTGTVGFGDDNLDWYKVTPSSNGQLSITVENLQTGSVNDDLDRAILYNSEFTYLSEAGSGSSCCPLIPGGVTYTSTKATVTGGKVHFIRIGPYDGLDASFYTVRANFEEITQEDTGEPNNSSELATVLNIDEPSTGIVGFGDDNLDWYKVTPSSNGQLSITVENLQTGSVNDDLDRAILYNSELTYLSEAGSGSSCCPLIPGGVTYTSTTVTVTGGETYYIRIGPDDGLDASFYTVRVNFEE